MTGIFSSLMEVAEKQQEEVKQSITPATNGQMVERSLVEKSNISIKKNHAQRSAQKIEQTVEQLSKLVSSEAVEVLAFQLHLQKVNMRKINTNVPEEWGAEIEELAHKLRVGKYDLVMYMIGKFLGKI